MIYLCNCDVLAEEAATLGASVIQATRTTEASDLVCDHTFSLHLDEVRSDFVLRTPSTGQ